MRWRVFAGVLLLLGIAGHADVPELDPRSWPESQRSFLEDGPGWLVDEGWLEQLAAADEPGRQRLIDEFLALDPNPDTPENELLEAIRFRQQLMRTYSLSPFDLRARLVFLNGEPLLREEIECGQTFRPLQIWTYGPVSDPTRLLLYRRSTEEPYRLWLPTHGKRVLYTDEMQYYLEQYYELRGRINAKRFDLQTCPETRKIDDATGVDGLFGYRSGRPRNEDFLAFLAPPGNLRAWAAAAIQGAAIESRELPIDEVGIFFPDRRQQRIVARMIVKLSEQAVLEPAVNDDNKEELRLAVDGVLEQDGQIFDEFRVRFKLDPLSEPAPIALVLERALRPNRSFVVRLKVADQTGGAETFVTRAFSVPAQPQPKEELPEGAGNVVVAVADQLMKERIPGADSLILVPPGDDEVALSVWRAEALVTGEAIRRVVFMVDSTPQLTRTRPPYTAEVRLAKFPQEHIVRAEGYDESDELIAFDEVILNQPRGALRVRILEPARGTQVSGRVTARAEVVVPEGRFVETVEFRLNDAVVEEVKRPPWQADLEVPGAGTNYLAVVATLDNGSRAEDVRFLNAPQYLEEVDVRLVELFTTVTDRTGRPVKGLEADDFEVYEDGRKQRVSKFELVEDLALTLGIAIDTSGSMVSALPEARQAAIDFLENIITGRDRVFAVGFSGIPVLLVPPTDDVVAVEESLDDLRSLGATTLHDAIVTSLYYFRGVRGRRALILLSDGDDTASHIPFESALEYAQRSGVVIYTVGLDVGRLKAGIRKKLTALAEETGGRVFFISEAEELSGVYSEIEDELRSQYFLAYPPDRPGGDGKFRTIEVKARDGKLRARTIRGYYG